MRARWFLVATGCSLGVSVAVACSSFGEDVGTPANDGSAEGMTLGESGSDATPPPDGPTSTGTFTLATYPATAAFRGIAANETTVFFAEQTTGHVWSVPLAGGSPKPVSSTVGAPLAVAVDANTVYWTDNNSKTVHRRSFLAGADIVGPQSSTTPFALAPAGTKIIAVTDSEIQLLDPTSLANLGALIQDLDNPYDVAAVGGDFYWTEAGPTAKRVVKGTVGSAVVESVSTAEGDCRAIAADARGAYWVLGNNTIRAAVPSNSGAKTVSAAEPSVKSIATDGSTVYWIRADGMIRKWDPVSLALADALATGTQPIGTLKIHGLAVTSRYLVWLTADGRVLRHEK